MGLLFQLAKFLPRGRGRLSRIEEMLDRHSRIFEGIDAEDRATVRPNPRGSFTISASGSRGGARYTSYTSYFKVYDASTTDVCKIGVKDGGWLDPEEDPGICGTIKINKFVVNVPTYLSDSILIAGFFYVWLVSWISESDGAGCKIVVGDLTRPTETDISAPDVISYGSQLLGRAYVELVEGKARIMGITQDYLRGGEAVELLWGMCGDDVEVDL